MIVLYPPRRAILVTESAKPQKRTVLKRLEAARVLSGHREGLEEAADEPV